MARRASSGLNPGIILVVVVVVGAIIFGGKMLLGGDKKPFAGVPRLEIQDMMDNGNSLQQDVFVIEGEIDEKIKFSDKGHQLVSVRVEGKNGDGFISIEIPKGITKQNIETRQRYAIKIEFKKGGLAVATGIERL